METTMIILIVLIALLAALFLLRLTVWRSKFPRRRSPLTSVAFLFILAGIVFSEPKALAYGLFGAAVVVAVVDMILKHRVRKEESKPVKKSVKK